MESFLTSEEGKITKQAMLVAGGILGTIAAGSIASDIAEAGTAATCDPGTEGYGSCTGKDPCHCYAHRNSGDYVYGSKKLDVSHNHHYNHGSHASHASHSSY